MALHISSHCPVVMLNGKIRTLFFSFILLVLGCFIGKVSAQETVDEIISSAANSSDVFNFLHDGEDFVIRTELDMLYTREQWSELIRLNNTVSRKKRKAIKTRRYRWTNKIVPYEIYGYFSQSDKNQVKMAINEWNHYTCLRFRPALSNDRNRIRMQNGGGCSSYVGMQGGTQPVSLARNCRVKKIIVHELGHAIGFQHEQTRPDRDRYVYILRQNIPGSMYFNFQRYTTGYVDDYRVPYDYTSVMHYGAYAFSHNGQRTIQTKNSQYQNIIGKAPGLSFRDIKLANLMYQCGSHCKGKSCPGQGYLDKNCECICPGPNSYQPTKKCSGGGGGGGGNKDCVDKNESCKYWASKGECKNNPNYMLVNCKKSCKKCGGGGGGGGGDENKGDCVDKNESCNYWASNGECQNNPDYMLVNCKKSCKNCSGGGGGGEDKGDCVDKHENCAVWAKNDECNKNPAYMHVNCKKSCKKCKKEINCIDKNKNCAFWASNGECTKNPSYMIPNCQKSCKKCSSSGEGTEVIPKELQCTDENKQCSSWALLGECQKNPNYMLQYCKKSCQYCPSKDEAECNNFNVLCPIWASTGECTKNPAYMVASCRKSCKLCQSHLAARDLPCFDMNNNCSVWKSRGYCTDPLYKLYMTTNCPQSCDTCS